MSYSGITSIVDQLTGRSGIPASAKPVTKPSHDRPAARRVEPSPEKSPKPTTSRERLLAAFDDEWRCVDDLAARAQVARQTVYNHVAMLIEVNVIEQRRVSWTKGVRVQYRRRSQ